MLENIYHNNGGEGKGRQLLVKVYFTFITKISTLKDFIPKLLEVASSRTHSPDTHTCHILST